MSSLIQQEKGRDCTRSRQTKKECYNRLSHSHTYRTVSLSLQVRRYSLVYDTASMHPSSQQARQSQPHNFTLSFGPRNPATTAIASRAEGIPSVQTSVAQASQTLPTTLCWRGPMNAHTSTRTSLKGRVTLRPAPTTLVQRGHSRAHTSKYITRGSLVSPPTKPYSNHTTTANYSPFVPQHVVIGSPTEKHTRATRCDIHLKSEIRKKKQSKKAKLVIAIVALNTHIPSKVSVLTYRNTLT